LDDDLSSKVLKFADDTKVFRTVKTDTDKETLQDDQTKLVKWSEKWLFLCMRTNSPCMRVHYSCGCGRIGRVSVYAIRVDTDE